MEQVEEAGLEEVHNTYSLVCPSILIRVSCAAPQIRPLAINWQDRGRGNYQAGRQCNASIHRRPDGNGVDPDWYVFILAFDSLYQLC